MDIKKIVLELYRKSKPFWILIGVSLVLFILTQDGSSLGFGTVIAYLWHLKRKEKPSG